MKEDKSQQLKNIIERSQSLVLITGAGVSTPSGLSDFESIYSRLFEGYDPVSIMTKGFLEERPDVFLRFMRTYFAQQAEPNVCHKFIAALENMDKKVNIITQNVDGLHQQAGSHNVHEIHGTLNHWQCTCCHHEYNMQEALNSDNLKCSQESCPGLIRPDIVFYGESFSPEIYDSSMNALQSADTLIVIGTSLQTAFPYNALKYFQGSTVFINKHRIKGDLPREVDLELYANAEEVFESMKNILPKQGFTK